MKKRETKSELEDAGRRTALVRAGSRWLLFARTLARGRGRLAVSNTLSFIESLYGGKFKAAEGSAFALDKVYRMVGGGLSVSETRLNVSVHPRFDLRLLNVSGGSASSQVLREAPPPQTTTRTLLSHTGAGGREQPRAARHSTNVDARSFQSHSTILYQTIAPVAFTLLQQRTHFGPPQTITLLHAASAHNVNAPSLTAHTWNVLTTGAERHLPAFGYVSVRGQRAQQAQGVEPARPPLFSERLVRGDVTTGTSTETSRPPDASSPASHQLTSLDLRRPIIHAPRQEFVSVLLQTYLPVIESRESLSVRTTRDSSGATQTRATAQGETMRRFTPAHGVAERQAPGRTYAAPTTRQQPASGVEIRREFREFRSSETVRERATAPHASARDARPPLLHVLSPTSLLSLSEDFLSVLAGGAGGQGSSTYQLGGHAPALPLQRLRTRTAPSGTREGSAAVQAPRLFAQTPQHQTTHQTTQQATHRPTGTREVLSSIHTFVGRVHTTFAGPQTRAGITRAGYSTVFTRPGFESVLRRGFEQESARQRGASSEAAPGHAITLNLFERTGELVRPASVAEFTRDASSQETSTRISLEQEPRFFSTHGAPGAGTFLFSTALLRRVGGASTAGALSLTAAMALRLSAAGETARASSEARAARPEGMALELIRQRREEVLQLPKPGYVFTQPARTQLEERQVITKASREEIVEVVRKEVRTLAASTPATVAASRADLAGIADEVYSTLVRRLLVEKERLGRA